MSRIMEFDGLPVVNGKHPIMLTVTKSDISKAEPKDPSRCAVALACRRQLGCIEARIHLGRVYIRTNQSNWWRYVTPASMRQEIVVLDRGGTFEARAFRLQSPPPRKQTGTKQGGRNKPGRKRPKTSKPRPYHLTTNVRTGPA